MKEFNRLHELGERDRKVLEHFLEFGNKKAAYKHVYHKAPDYRINKFFNKSIVKELIKEFKQGVETKAVQVMEEQGFTLGYIQSRLKWLIDFNINKFVVIKDNQPYFDFTTATDQDWYCISELTSNQVLKDINGELWPCNAIKFKTNCKIKALELAGKTIGAYTDKVENTGVQQIVMNHSYDFEEDDDDE